MSHAATDSGGLALDVTKLIDGRRIGLPQVFVFIICGLVAVIDGMDNLAMAATASTVAKDLSIALPKIALVLAATQFGSVAGSVVFGLVSDRYGRRMTLIAAAFMFSIFTCSTPFAAGLSSLLVIRVLAGIGIGAALPCFLSLAAEFAPARQRRMVVSLVWVGYSIGISLGGFLNAYVLGTYGWHMVFYVDAAIGLLVAAVAWLALPESISFALVTRNDQVQARAILRRIAPDVETAGRMLVTPAEPVIRASIGSLFASGQGLQTTTLWAAFLFGFGGLSAMTQWTPTFLTMHGVPPATAANAVSFGGLGAIVGLVVGGYVSQSPKPYTYILAAFLTGAAAIGVLANSLETPLEAQLMVMVASLFLGIAVAGLMGLAATMYPTAIRATGVGAAMANSRVGQVAFPLLAGALLQAAFAPEQIMGLTAAYAVLAGLATWTCRMTILGRRTPVAVGAPVP